MPHNTHQAKITFALLVCGTVLGLAGIDLVLPAIPSLPNAISGSIESAQLVLASFAAGTAIGLLVFGELGARFDQRRLLIGSLMLYATMSYMAGQAESINELVAIRSFQGFTSAAPAVFAPGIIRSMFDQRGAIKAIGLMGSIESLTPALAPVAGAWLLTFSDWRASFYITAALALVLTIAITFFGGTLLSTRSQIKKQQKYQASYFSLFNNREFMRQGLSHACTLGGLLIFVFGAPTVIITSMDGDLTNFVIMQLIGISLFIISANLSARLVTRFGSAVMINIGSSLTAFGCLAIYLFSLFGDGDPRWLWLLFAPVNLGLGLRGPPGFYQAVVAAGENDSRGAALLILFILGIAAAGTAVVAPFISQGLMPLSAAAATVTVGSVVILATLRSPGLSGPVKKGIRR
jgi:DHA1 family bicyclomycin/chloramphenicol resistance-like MFS transporter